MFKVGDKVYTTEDYDYGGYVGIDEHTIMEVVDVKNKRRFFCKGTYDWGEEFLFSFEKNELKLFEGKVDYSKIKEETNSIVGLKGTTSEFISMDYRTEYYKKVEECERLKSQIQYLWDSILRKKD